MWYLSFYFSFLKNLTFIIYVRTYKNLSFRHRHTQAAEESEDYDKKRFVYFQPNWLNRSYWCLWRSIFSFWSLMYSRLTVSAFSEDREFCRAYFIWPCFPGSIQNRLCWSLSSGCILSKLKGNPFLPFIAFVKSSSRLIKSPLPRTSSLAICSHFSWVVWFLQICDIFSRTRILYLSVSILPVFSFLHSSNLRFWGFRVFRQAICCSARSCLKLN